MHKKRSQTIDIAKGLAIIAIVAGHVWRGLASADLISDELAVFQHIDRTLYMFHLSVFAFVAGLFVQNGMERHGRWQHVRSRSVEFLWLHIVWSTVQISIKLLMGSNVNDAATPSDLVTLWIPKEQFWFLGWLAVAMLVAAIGRPWETRQRAICGSLVISTVSLLSWGIGGTFIGTQGWALMLFYWTALLVGGSRLIRLLDMFPWHLHLLLGAITLAAMITLVVATNAVPPTEGLERSLGNVALGVVASSLGVLATLMTSSFFACFSFLTRFFAYLGRLSLAIFVAHVFFTAAVRLALIKLNVDSLVIHSLLGLFFGVVGPLCMYRVAQVLKFRWLFALPGFAGKGLRP